MSYWRGIHTMCGGIISFAKDISEDEAWCENCGWVDIWAERGNITRKGAGA